MRSNKLNSFFDEIRLGSLYIEADDKRFKKQDYTILKKVEN